VSRRKNVSKRYDATAAVTPPVTPTMHRKHTHEVLRWVHKHSAITVVRSPSCWCIITHSTTRDNRHKETLQKKTTSTSHLHLRQRERRSGVFPSFAGLVLPALALCCRFNYSVHSMHLLKCFINIDLPTPQVATSSQENNPTSFSRLP